MAAIYRTTICRTRAPGRCTSGAITAAAIRSAPLDARALPRLRVPDALLDDKAARSSSHAPLSRMDGPPVTRAGGGATPAARGGIIPDVRERRRAFGDAFGVRLRAINERRRVPPGSRSGRVPDAACAGVRQAATEAVVVAHGVALVPLSVEACKRDAARSR